VYMDFLVAQKKCIWTFHGGTESVYGLGGTEKCIWTEKTNPMVDQKKVWQV